MKKTKDELYNLWINISPLPGWYRLLKIVNSISNHYDDEDFSYLEKLDQDFMEIEKEAKKDYYIEKERYNKQMLEMQKEMKEEHRDWVRGKRINFLQEEIKKLNNIISSSYEIYFDQQRRDIPYWLRQAILLINKPEKLTKLHGKLINELYFLENKKESNENILTQEEIVHARNYPFERLIEVNEAKFAKCPFHNEEKGSFFVKNNFGYCFGCQWSGDTIKFVIETQGLTFLDAVRKLNNR